MQIEDNAWDEDEPEVERNVDIADSIRGFYRILDLINERGSGGLGVLLSLCLLHYAYSASVAQLIRSLLLKNLSLVLSMTWHPVHIRP
jgi:hypothetical protein